MLTTTPRSPTRWAAGLTEEGGVWIDGEALYQADGDFVLNLRNIYGPRYSGDDAFEDVWIFYDENGDVSITDTQKACEAAARPDVAPSYRNHCVECLLDYADGGVSITFNIPVERVPADQPSAWFRDRSLLEWLLDRLARPGRGHPLI